MENETELLGQEEKKVKVNLRYNTTDTVFASQFLVNTTREELILNLSSGYMSDPGTDERLLPIHTRIALTPQGAARLANTLASALKNMQSAAQANAEEKAEES
jgi:hypothetical protein